MKRLVKPIAKITITLLLGGVMLSSCALSGDEEVLDDISSELNEKTTDLNEGKKDK